MSSPQIIKQQWAECPYKEELDRMIINNLFPPTNEKERIDRLNLHIHLGNKQGFDVSYLVELRQQRYLLSWDLYL